MERSCHESSFGGKSLENGELVCGGSAGFMILCWRDMDVTRVEGNLHNSSVAFASAKSNFYRFAAKANCRHS